MGVLSHSLPMLFVGYGILGGCGIGMSYVPPVATLLRWFPDKRGLATGLTLMGFGGGAFVATPIISKLFSMFKKAPEYVGSAADTHVIIEGGRRFVETAGGMKEVVLATAKDVSLCGFEGLREGLYLVGSGSTGAGETLVALGVGYMSLMLASASLYRVPHRGYSVRSSAASAQSQEGDEAKAYVHVDTAMKTPQFWQLWLTFCGIATSGMGLISVASTIMRDIFAGVLPNTVTRSD